MPKNIKTLIIPDERVLNKIYLIRAQKIMLDLDLADLYEVETKVLNQAVKRNKDRFPEDFMFQLTADEWKKMLSSQEGAGNLKSQIVTSSWGGRRKLPYAFTEQGVAMLSSVLNSPTAIDVNIQIIRVFTKMRGLLLTHKDILLQLEKMEKKIGKHDEQIALVFDYLKKLLSPSQPPRQRIGFRRKDEKD
jgi:hypothetical protein